MKVTVSMDRTGALLFVPVSKSIQASIVRAAKDNGAPESFDGTLYVQNPRDVVRLLIGRMEELYNGYTVTINSDAWDYRHMCGYCSD